MGTLKVALVAIVALTRSAAADWQVASTANERSTVAGVEHRRVVANDPATSAHATLDLALFSTKTETLRVIDDPSASFSLAEVMRRENCIAGVNGGYFDPEDAPVGLSISDGRVLAPLRKARLLSGVVSVVNGHVRIQRPAEFSMKSKPTNARQCGPFLVENGKAIAGLNDTRAARRTFVVTSGNERAAIGYCSGVTLAQLAKLLTTQGLAPEFKVQRALNLDGGSSSGFWFAGEKGAFSIREQKSVRDFLAVVAK